MLNKLQVLEDKYKELTEKISDIEVINDQKTWQKYMKEHADLEPIVMKYREYKEVVDNIKESKEILEEESDEELRELAKMELSDLESRVEPIEDELKILLLPKDPNDEKNVIVEIRGGAGGDEAALFAGDLFRMYSRYAERRRWKTELLSASDTGVGGYKEVSFMIKGKGAYSRLKYESGVHRVQRIPSTESGGRIHTSTATVAVLPEVEDVEVEINPNDLRIDVFRASGNGGQCVNTTDSAVRITHIPTNIVVACQSERSQIQNRETAMKMLKSKLFDLKEKEQKETINDLKGEQKDIAWGSQIRSYVFCPYTLVKDHRTNYEVGNVQTVMDGNLDGFIESYLKYINSNK